MSEFKSEGRGEGRIEEEGKGFEENDVKRQSEGGRVEVNKRAGRERCKGELVGEGVVRLGVCKGPALPAGPGPSGPLTSPVYLATTAAPHSFESPHLSSSSLCHKTARVLLPRRHDEVAVAVPSGCRTRGRLPWRQKWRIMAPARAASHQGI